MREIFQDVLTENGDLKTKINKLLTSEDRSTLLLKLKNEKISAFDKEMKEKIAKR